MRRGCAGPGGVVQGGCAQARSRASKMQNHIDFLCIFNDFVNLSCSMGSIPRDLRCGGGVGKSYRYGRKLGDGELGQRREWKGERICSC